MPTKHREQMVKAGLAPAHHGHDKRAIAVNKKLDDDQQALRDGLDSPEKAEARAVAYAENRKAREERHKAERALAKTSPQSTSAPSQPRAKRTTTPAKKPAGKK